MPQPEAIVVEVDIAAWRAAVGKVALTEAALLSLVNQRMARIAPGLTFETLMPSSDPRRNWKVGPYAAGLRDLAEDSELLRKVARAIATLGEIHEVAWPSSDLH